MKNSYETLYAQLFTLARAQRFRVLNWTSTVVSRRELRFDDAYSYTAERLAYKARHDFQYAQGNLDNCHTHRSAYYNLCKKISLHR